MPSRQFEQMMWAQACEMLDRAERLQRGFFRPEARSPQWEPPVDVYDTGEGVLLVVALPGAQPSTIEVTRNGGELVIRAERALPVSASGSAVRRLEIPHGRFERRLRLAPGEYELAEREWVDGCLYLHLRIA